MSKWRQSYKIILLLLTLIVITNLQPARANQSSVNIWATGSFPVENFQAYTSPFGYRHSATGGSGWEFHSGLDIAAKEGSYIHSWWTGTVIRVGDHNACGTHIAIQSGQWEHIYCHMEGHVESVNGHNCAIEPESGMQTCEGDQVVAGTKIGRVGMTGRTTGPHLHWSLKYNNEYLDPALVLQAMFSKAQVVKKPTAEGNSQQSQLRIEESKYIRDFTY